MAQAQTLTDAQLRRCLKWCQMRRHSTRDTTIFYVSYYAGLRAKEIAALTVGDDDIFKGSGALEIDLFNTGTVAPG